MANELTLSRFDGNFKVRYADKLEKLITPESLIQEDIKFSKKDATGKKFVQGVQTKLPQNVTYRKSGSAGFTYNWVGSGEIKEAELTGSQIVVTDRIDLEAAFSGEAAEVRFDNTVDAAVEGIWQMGRIRLELDLLYGQSAYGIGVVSGTPAANVVTIATANWIPGLWENMVGAELEVFSSDLATQRAGDGAADQYTVTACDFDNYTITVDDDVNIADGDIIFFRDAVTAGTTPTYDTMAGFLKVAPNAGSLFGIDAASYPRWLGNSVAVGGRFSFVSMLAGAAKLTNRGLMGDYVCYVCPDAWNDALTDMDALRRYDGKAKVLEQGAEKIAFITSVGKVTVRAHPLMMKGYGVMYDRKSFKRIGATDFTFRNPLSKAENNKASWFFDPVPNTNQHQIATYSHQALYGCPRKALLFTGITCAVDE